MRSTIATRRQVLAGASAAMAAAPVIASAQSAAAHGSGEASRLAARLFAGDPAPALSFAVARADGLAWAEACGQADLEKDVAATPAHTFRLGSISKVVTSTAAARLVSRGLLDLDAPIERWLPDLPGKHRATTLRQLLAHRGGVRHYEPKDLDLKGPGGNVYMRVYPEDRDILALFIDDPLVAPPGTSVTYSSYGYSLASLVMQAAAGKPFLELVQREVAEPFGLTSLAADDPWALQPARATGYLSAVDLRIIYGGGGLPDSAWPALTGSWANMPSYNPAFCWAGAGLLMTPSDTASFGAAMLDSVHGRITPAERALLFTSMTEAAATSPPLGLGWRIDADAKGRRRWHHAGATPGGRHALVVYPELGVSVAMAGNVMAMMLDVMKASSDLADVFA